MTQQLWFDRKYDFAQ